VARVKTFLVHPEKGPHDLEIARFITECEEKFYVNVVTQYLPVPTPRVLVIVTKLDEKDPTQPQSQLQPQQPPTRAERTPHDRHNQATHSGQAVRVHS